MDRFSDIQERLAAGLGMLAQRLPSILESPRAYPREAMLLAIIAALALILIALFVVALIDYTKSRTRRRRLGVVRRRSRHWPVYLLAAMLLVLLALVLAPGVVFVGASCGSCHAVSSAVEAWQADRHAGVSCYGCHAQPGVFGAAQAGAQGAVRLVTGVSSAGVYESRCVECHDEIAEGVVEGGIRMRHSDVIDAGFACTGCHPYAGHEQMERDVVTIERSRMALCLGCHDGVTASSECDMCHLRRPSDRTDGVKSASTPAPVTCEGCHSAETEANCIECHGLELPHPEPFFGEHAGRSWDDPTLCMRCHEEAAADAGCGCHGEENLHGTYTEWFPRHGPQAQLIWPGGCNCHPQSFCEMCHPVSPF